MSGFFNEGGIIDWITESPSKGQREFREAVHIALSGISNDADLQSSMVMKGGVLLAIKYRTHRHTTDIDFSTNQSLAQNDKDEIQRKLNQSMAIVAENLGYDLECRVQSCKVQPSKNPNAKFPSIKMKIGYAYKYEPKHKRLLDGKSPTTLDIDFSMNELMLNTENFAITEGETIRVYSLADLFAEKYRAVLQQKARNRQRRQDVYDLFLLIKKLPETTKLERKKIKTSLMKKAASRGIEANSESLQDPEIRQRSRAEYHTLQNEIEGELPEFEDVYDTAKTFYEQLPW